MEQPNAEYQNELELKLAATLAGDIPGNEFIQYLLNAQIFMPIRDETTAIKGFQRSTNAQPLIVEDEDGLQILALFTSPARARAFAEEFPDYKGGLLTEFSWVLRKLLGPMNIALNPDHENGLDMDEEMVASLLSICPRHSPRHCAIP